MGYVEVWSSETAGTFDIPFRCAQCGHATQARVRAMGHARTAIEHHRVEAMAQELGPARETADAVARAAQHRQQAPADVAGRAGQEDPLVELQARAISGPQERKEDEAREQQEDEGCGKS